MLTSPDRHGIGGNGGPPLVQPVVQIGAKFMPIFQRYRHKAFYGGRGSAKSHTIAQALVMISCIHGLLIVCARQFQNSIKDSSKELIETKIKAMGLSQNFKITEREIVNIATGARFIFIGLDRNPESAKSLEGADICWVEEARTINSRSMEILIPTIRKPGSEIWWSWNPEFSDDPVDNYFRGTHSKAKGEQWAPPPNSYICQVGIEDNPWFYHTELPQEMWHMQEGNPKRYRHVWLGEYDESYETKVFSDIVIGRIDVPKGILPRYGMDFGFGSDPSFILRAYVLHNSKQIYIAREFCGRVPLRDLPAAMDTIVDDRQDLIYCDSSQPGTIDHLNSEGFNCVGAKKGPGSVKAGINWLQGFQIVIDPDCSFMREEARLYSWQVDRRTLLVLPVPVDAHNHGWDALRYATEDAQTAPDPISDGGVFRINFGGRRRR